MFDILTNKPESVKDRRIRIITETADLNGKFLRETLGEWKGNNTETADNAVAVATARAISVLICLRGAADSKPVTGTEIQAAIDAFMAGAQVETYLSGMGAELYRDKEQTS